MRFKKTSSHQLLRSQVQLGIRTYRHLYVPNNSNERHSLGAPQQHTRVQYDNSITVTAEIENKIYKLQSPQMLDPGDYPASEDKGIVRLHR